MDIHMFSWERNKSLGEIQEEKKGKRIEKLHGFMEWNRCSLFHLVAIKIACGFLIELISKIEWCFS